MWNRARVTDADPAPLPARSVYRVRRAYFARALGRGAIIAAVLVALTTLCLEVSAPTAVTVLLVVLTVVALVVVAVVAVSVMLPPTLLQLDERGFRASRRFTAGPRQGGWLDVHSAASQEGPEGWVLIIAHHGGEHTAVPLRLVDARPVTVEQDVRARLNEAHGYQGLA
jgi:hypothetical protein